MAITTMHMLLVFTIEFDSSCLGYLGMMRLHYARDFLFLMFLPSQFITIEFHDGPRLRDSRVGLERDAQLFVAPCVIANLTLHLDPPIL